MFFMTTVFAFPFFGYIDTPQIVFYFAFVVYAILNIVFLSLSPMQRENFIRARYFTVYLPSVILILIQIAAFVIFLKNLDDINQKLDNMYPVDEASSLMKQYFVIMNILTDIAYKWINKMIQEDEEKKISLEKVKSIL